MLLRLQCASAGQTELAYCAHIGLSRFIVVLFAIPLRVVLAVDINVLVHRQSSDRGPFPTVLPLTVDNLARADLQLLRHKFFEQV